MRRWRYWVDTGAQQVLVDIRRRWICAHQRPATRQFAGRRRGPGCRPRGRPHTRACRPRRCPGLGRIPRQAHSFRCRPLVRVDRGRASRLDFNDLHGECPQSEVAGRSAAGRSVLATFGRPRDAAVAVEKLLDAGFVNVEQEVEGSLTLVIVDAGDRQDLVREILIEQGGVEFDPPDQ